MTTAKRLGITPSDYGPVGVLSQLLIRIDWGFGLLFWTRYVDSFNVWRMNADGTGQETVLASPFSDMAPSVSPDGAAIVFTSDRVLPSTIFTLPLAGGPPRQLTNISGWASGTDQDPYWSR